MTNQTKLRHTSGFTLVELLVVIGIIALMVSILLPALNKARQQAASVACLARLRQIGLAVDQYRTTNKNWYPPAETTYHGSWAYSGPSTTANLEDKEARWFHYLKKYVGTYQIFNCTELNNGSTAYRRPGVDTQVKYRDGDGTPVASWIVIGSSAVGTSSNYAYNAGTLGFAALISTVPWTPKEQFACRNYSLVHRIARESGTDMSHLIIVTDGAYVVRQLAASSANQDGLLDAYRFVHPGPRQNIIFGDGHAEGKMAKQLKQGSTLIVVTSGPPLVQFNANALYAAD